MKEMLFMFSLLISNASFGQADSIVMVSGPVKVLGNVKYIKITDRISYRFNCMDYSSPNIRFTGIKNKPICEELNDSNRVTCSYGYKPSLNIETTYLPADSLEERIVNKAVLGSDTTLPGQIVLSSFYPLKHGEYIEYFINGGIKVKGSYNNGNKVKVWKYYEEDGRILKTERYRKGVLKKVRLKV